jgi:hypothetical protein
LRKKEEVANVQNDLAAHLLAAFFWLLFSPSVLTFAFTPSIPLFKKLKYRENLDFKLSTRVFN